MVLSTKGLLTLGLGVGFRGLGFMVLGWGQVGAGGGGGATSSKRVLFKWRVWACGRFKGLGVQGLGLASLQRTFSALELVV